jgi:hypothetical protein
LESIFLDLHSLFGANKEEWGLNFESSKSQATGAQQLRSKFAEDIKASINENRDMVVLTSWDMPLSSTTSENTACAGFSFRTAHRSTVSMWWVTIGKEVIFAGFLSRVGPRGDLRCPELLWARLDHKLFRDRPKPLKTHLDVTVADCDKTILYLNFRNADKLH